MRSITTLMLVLGCALAYHAAAPRLVQADKYKVKAGGKTYKVKCGEGYGALGPFDLRLEKRSGKGEKRWVEDWRTGEAYFSNPGTLGLGWTGCGCQCSESVPTRKTRTVGTRGYAMAILEHPGGYYLFFGANISGAVRTTDALLIQLADGSEIELYPICESSGEERKACGIYSITVEEMKAFARAEVTDIKQFFRSTGGEGGAKIDVERTEEGREYVEFRKVGPQLKLTAFCMAKDVEASAK